MTEIDAFNFILNWTLKIGFLLLTFIFLAFAILFIRQVDVMTTAVEDPLNPKLKIISWLYFLLTLTILIFFVFYL